jgi:hypothetical protein
LIEAVKPNHSDLTAIFFSVSEQVGVMLPMPRFEGFGSGEAVTVKGDSALFCKRGVNCDYGIAFGRVRAYFGADVITRVIVIIIESQKDLVRHGGIPFVICRPPLL